MSMPSSSSSESGSESDYVAAVVTILLLLALIAVGLVIYLYKYQKACFAPSTTPNSSPGSSNNSLLEKPTIVNINEPPIFKKKSPIQEEGKGLLNTNLHTSPTADLHSYQHKKVFNPCENLINDMTHEPEETEQTSLKHV
ncbi:hypothetical protein LOTGIDRAFT_156529 [Lottia gigantea]|uniref:Uncharacterized protein n=1 Tax=Lottia gigantea TaxID=225164 RepID=V4AIL8_LOTGI|nr:hypothetical protein LOTGIDRAFT_156529 [Lottia gigantea]ESP03929.1 hypothetical protein LOTGIDRAFT_156529 [Lottia gigantea]